MSRLLKTIKMFLTSLPKDRFGYGIIMIMPNEKKRVSSSSRPLFTRLLFQRDISDSEVKKNVNGSLKSWTD